MTHQITWLHQGKIVLAKFSDNVSKDDIVEANADIVDLIKQGQPPIHIVIDAATVSAFPADPRLYLTTSEWLRNTHESSVGWVLLLIKSHLAKMTISIVTQVFHSRYRLMDSLEDALDFLRIEDNRLDLLEK